MWPTGGNFFQPCWMLSESQNKPLSQIKRNNTLGWNMSKNKATTNWCNRIEMKNTQFKQPGFHWPGTENVSQNKINSLLHVVVLLKQPNSLTRPDPWDYWPVIEWPKRWTKKETVSRSRKFLMHKNFNKNLPELNYTLLGNPSIPTASCTLLSLFNMHFVKPKNPQNIINKKLAQEGRANEKTLDAPA